MVRQASQRQAEGMLRHRKALIEATACQAALLRKLACCQSWTSPVMKSQHSPMNCDWSFQGSAILLSLGYSARDVLLWKRVTATFSSVSVLLSRCSVAMTMLCGIAFVPML